LKTYRKFSPPADPLTPVTMNVYGHVNLEAQRSALDHLDEQLS
jgi:hypothetical protein